MVVLQPNGVPTRSWAIVAYIAVGVFAVLEARRSCGPFPTRSVCTDTNDNHNTNNVNEHSSISGTDGSTILPQPSAIVQPIWLDKIQLPTGFEINVWARNISYARSLTISDRTGIVFCSSWNFKGISGDTKEPTVVYALQDVNHTGYASRVIELTGNSFYDRLPPSLAHSLTCVPFVEPLWIPNGITYYKGDLYLAQMDRILKYVDVGESLNRPAFSVVYILP
jgi:hypothetical protein